MDNKERERKYRNSLQSVEAGMRACWNNASELVRASGILLEHGFHAPGLSLSVLALEELGKLVATDGLLFADPQGSKAQRAAKADRSHSLKLSALPILPFMVGNLARVDPRHRKDEAYTAALVNGLKALKADYAAASLDGTYDFDRWKQQGFYAESGSLPSKKIDPSLAKAVHRLACTATSVLGLVLSDGNLERYIETARVIRSKMTEAEHQAFEQLGDEVARELFGPDDEHEVR
jgi:AbiV family abortive infection protein